MFGFCGYKVIGTITIFCSGFFFLLLFFSVCVVFVVFCYFCLCATYVCCLVDVWRYKRCFEIFKAYKSITVVYLGRVFGYRVL